MQKVTMGRCESEERMENRKSFVSSRRTYLRLISRMGKKAHLGRLTVISRGTPRARVRRKYT